MNKFIIQKSGSAIPGGTALLYRVFTRSAIAFHPGNAHQDDQKYQYQQGNADNANQAEIIMDAIIMAPRAMQLKRED